MCYQSAYKYKLDEIFDNVNETNTIIILDEIHDSLTPVYHKFSELNLVGNNIPRLGLSATIDLKTEYQTEDGIITKLDMLDSFCPIIFKHGLNDGLETKTSRELIFYVIRHRFNKTKDIETGSKTVKFNTSEEAMYQYLDKQFKRSLFLPKSNKSRDFMIRNAAARRARFLYTLPSKVEQCKLLLSKIFQRTIVFANDITTLELIVPVVISSNNSKEQNKDYLEKFNNKEFNVIGSFKMLQQGANLKDLDIVVLHSYYGKSKQLLQSVGRLRLNGKVGHVFTFVTETSQEQNWFNTMTENLNIRIIYCSDVSDAVTKYNKHANI